jgi:putative ABC transport system permease protein
MAKLKDIFWFVFKNAFERKLKVSLTILGIIIAIFIFIFFIFISNGLSYALSNQFNSLGVNDLIVKPYTSPALSAPVGEGLTDSDIDKIEQVISNYLYVAPGLASNCLVEYNHKKKVLMAVSYDGKYFEKIKNNLGIEIDKGRFLRQKDNSAVVIGHKVATDTFDKKINVGDRITIDNKKFRVIGIIKEKGDLLLDNGILMNLKDMQDISGINTYSFIRIGFINGTNLSKMEQKINAKLNKEGKEKKVTITSSKQVISKLNNILGVLTAIISLISFIALLVGGVNIMNTMYSNVYERINEISVMKAIGAKNKDIFLIYLIESSVFGFLGAIIGFILSYLLALLLSHIVHNILNILVPVYFDVYLFLGSIVFTILFSVFFGTYPALKASKINPAENLRDE